jgi:ABC-type multidrug transport system permease subunit
VLTGRTIADIATNALALTTMVVTGLLVGFDFDASAPEILGGVLLLFLIGYAFSWIFAWVGLNSSSPETANAFGFMTIFPLTFLSSAFAPPDSMPDALEFFAEDVNPFTTMVDAVRSLFLGTPAGNDIWGAVLWCVGLIALFSLLAARSYRNAIRG